MWLTCVCKAWYLASGSILQPRDPRTHGPTAMLLPAAVTLRVES